MENQDKIYTKAEYDEAVNKAREGALARASKGKVSQKEYDDVVSERDIANKKLTLATKLPSIKSKFKDLGGNDNSFDDYFKKHEEDLLNADEKTLEKTMKSTIENTKWAFDIDKGGDPTQQNEKDKKDLTENSLVA